jgi:hypothetical protein
LNFLKAADKVAVTDAKLCAVAPAFAYAAAATANAAAAAEPAAAVADLLSADLTGSVATKAADKPRALCQQTVLKAARKVFALKHKRFVLCKKAGLGRKILPFPSAAAVETCADRFVAAGTKDPLAKAVAKLAETIGKKCEPLDLTAAFPGSCGAADAAALTACVDRQATCRVCRLGNAADDLTMDCDALDDGNGGNATCP